MSSANLNEIRKDKEKAKNKRKKPETEMNNGENLKLIINVNGKLLLYRNNLRPLSFISYTPNSTAAAAMAQ